MDIRPSKRRKPSLWACFPARCGHMEAGLGGSAPVGASETRVPTRPEQWNRRSTTPGSPQLWTSGRPPWANLSVDHMQRPSDAKSQTRLTANRGHLPRMRAHASACATPPGAQVSRSDSEHGDPAREPMLGTCKEFREQARPSVAHPRSSAAAPWPRVTSSRSPPAHHGRRASQLCAPPRRTS